MVKHISLYVVTFVLVFAGQISAAEQYPLMDMIANDLIQKYQSATCEQLWENKQKAKSDRQKELIQILRDNPEMRTAFLNKVSGPVLNKMFECGMIP
jgi:hypothetical protein